MLSELFMEVRGESRPTAEIDVFNPATEGIGEEQGWSRRSAMCPTCGS